MSRKNWVAWAIVFVLLTCSLSSRAQNLVEPFVSQNEPHCLTSDSKGASFLIKNSCKVNLHIYWGPWADN
jgi:hypothetical protein